MSTSDKTQNRAKPVPHDSTHPRSKSQYEHEEITDNRLVWEVLEENDRRA